MSKFNVGDKVEIIWKGRWMKGVIEEEISVDYHRIKLLYETVKWYTNGHDTKKSTPKYEVEVLEWN